MATHPLTDREFSRQGPANRLIYPSQSIGLGEDRLVLPGVAANLVMPSVTIATIPAGIVIERIIAAFAWRKQVDSSAVLNAINGTQQIQVRIDTPGPFINAIQMSNNTLETVASATEGGMMLLGAPDLSTVVVGVGTYEFQWTLALVDGASLTLHDIQTYILIDHT